MEIKLYDLNTQMKSVNRTPDKGYRIINILLNLFKKERNYSKLFYFARKFKKLRVFR